MPKFQVSGELTISVHTIVEAANKKEALKLARERGVMGLCHQCADSRENEEEFRTSGELDGEPTNLRVEEA